MANESFYIIVLFLIGIYVLNKLFMYIRYKRSGKLVYKVQYKLDVLYIIVWGIIAFAWWIPVLMDLFKGNNVEGYRITNGIIWVVLMVVVSLVEAIKPKITEGGIYASGNFWSWREVQDCYWLKNDSNRLLVEVTSRMLFVKYPTALRWRVESKEKLKVENIIKAYKLKNQ